MESIDRLKKYVRANTDRTVLLTKYPEQYGVHCSTVINDLIDAIEREVEECYVELPKDADGVTISSFDSMVDRTGEQFVVSSIELLDNGEWLLYAKGKLGSEFATSCRHHKTSTVEDVLRDFAYCFEDGVTDKSLDEIVAEYAPKLQLREDD